MNIAIIGAGHVGGTAPRRPPFLRMLYDALQGVELDRLDAIVAEDVVIDTPVGLGVRGLAALKALARQFADLGCRIHVVEEHLALDGHGGGRGFMTFAPHRSCDHRTSVETMLLTIRDDKIVRIDLVCNGVRAEPLVVGIERCR
jgi:SnoaL-like protein